MSIPESIVIYDTTLRDGTQGLGLSFSSLDKLRVAERLDDFGVDYIEGGWPGSNPKDVDFFSEARKRKWKNAKIAAFGSTRRADKSVETDLQIKTLLEAETPVITFFGKTWKLHVTEVLRTTPEENQSMIRDTANYLKEQGREVIYDAEHFFDGYKDDPQHAIDTIIAAEQGGADVIVLCDTNGGTMPHEIHKITTDVSEKLSVPLGIHTHDDTGVGVANALAAVTAGVSHVQGTINGYGERTGNCNLTSAIPNLELKMGASVRAEVSKLTNISHFVDDLGNNAHNERAPYVGRTAFSHKGGMHVNAVQKLSRSYEHIEPETIGNSQIILISELSGQSNVLMKAKELGHDLEKGSETAVKILTQLKELEKDGYEFEAAEGSFELLVRKAIDDYHSLFKLQEYHCSTRRHPETQFETCEATVKLEVDDKLTYTVAEGDGPVNALDGALRKALEPFYPRIKKIKLRDYKVRIIDSHTGTAAKTRVLIVSTDGDETWGTVGVSDNIIVASWKALVDSFEFYLLRSLKK